MKFFENRNTTWPNIAQCTECSIVNSFEYFEKNNKTIKTVKW